MIEALKTAQSIVCSYCCTSHWKTADGPPQHSDECKAIQAAIEQADIDAGWNAAFNAIAAEVGTNTAHAVAVGAAIAPADWRAVDDFCEREAVRAVCNERGEQIGVEINKLRLAQCFAKHREEAVNPRRDWNKEWGI